MPDVDEMKVQIIMKLQTGPKTFSHLEQHIDGFCDRSEPKEGELLTGMDLQHPAIEQLYIWDRLTAEAVDALMELAEAGAIVFTPCSAVAYALDGQTAPWPVVDQAFLDTPEDERKPHWTPCLLGRPECPAKGQVDV